MPKFSIIIPVYNRPDEIDELLSSLLNQTFKDFEVLVIEDGSSDACDKRITKYLDSLNIQYHFKDNSGPGLTRNYGADRAKGKWFIFLDSDTILPADYLGNIDSFLSINEIDAFGGADRDSEDFLPIQRAISFSMTSLLTTGGIRGSKNSMEKFKPRSFNMGIKASVFQELGGFGAMRYGEDIDFSLRIENNGFRTAYIPGAYLYHRRRTSFSQFFKQIQHSGEARVLLSRIHKGSLKIVHLFPVFFVIGILVSMLGLFVLPMIGFVGLLIYGTYFLLILSASTWKNKDLKIGILSVVTSLIQLSAYGYGFLKSIF